MIDIEKFKAARMASGLSQSRLAKVAGVSQQLIGEIEAGRSRTTKSIYKISEALNIKAYELDDEIPAPEADWDTAVGELRLLTKEEQEFALKNLRDFIQLVKNRRQP